MMQPFTILSDRSVGAERSANSTPLDRAIALRSARATSPNAGPSKRLRRESRSPDPNSNAPGVHIWSSDPSRARVRSTQDIAEQPIYVVPSSLDAPDRLLFFEKSLSALQASLLMSFTASH